MADNLKIKNEAVVEYLDECNEMLERFARNLSVIESSSQDQETLAAIYRDIHTIKGNSQLFGFHQIGSLAHAMETCLDPVRKGTMETTPALIDVLYSCSDIIASLLKGIRDHSEEIDHQGKINSLIARLVDVAEVAATGSQPINEDKIPSLSDRREKTLSQEAKELGVSHHNNDGHDELQAAVVDKEPCSLSTSSKDNKDMESSKVTGPNMTQERYDNDSNSEVVAVVDESKNETIRVQVSILDNLMNLVGELVLIRNQLLQNAKSNDDNRAYAQMSQKLNILTGELQNEVMKTRMQPVGNILNKFTRIIRDIGRELGKRIDLDIYGAETELDKTIIEAIKDPLTHIVRNSADHGIESPSERKSSGKHESGQIILKAYHESGQVIIEISDDGRGLDPVMIGAKGMEKGIVTKEALAGMSDREIQYLIFAPGFSTAASVSSLSGRGVGMDVVKTNIERIGGMVDVVSKAGYGSTIKLKIPLTLAIVPALIVKTAGQRFTIPQSKLVELVRIDMEESFSEKIETLQGSPVLRLRGNILPLIHLGEMLKLAEVSAVNDGNRYADTSVNVVILNADGFQFGLIVDQIEDTADIVVKALSGFLSEISHFSGATIMGDGSVALTIDVMGVSADTRASKEDSHQPILVGNDDKQLKNRHQLDEVEFLLVDVGAPSNYAIPLTLVSRLEEFSHENFELSGEQKVVGYRDSLLPIFSLSEYLHLPFKNQHLETEKTSVVVIQRGEELYGIEVGRIADVVTLPSNINQKVRDRPGILGTMINGEKVLVVVDILAVIDSMKTALNVVDQKNETEMNFEKSNKINRAQHRILLAEDSSFFRNYVRQVLHESGFQVDVACDGQEAFAILEQASPDKYALVLSDIEMPLMDGFELARRVREISDFQKLPLVALTTRFSGADIEKGRQVGFTRYMEKLNADKLIAAIDELLCDSLDA